MVTKKELLKNIRNYSPQEIADAVRTGVVSLYELGKETEGAFTPLLRRQVKNILDTPVLSPQAASDSETVTETIEQPSSIEQTSSPTETLSMPVEPIIPVMSLTEPDGASATEDVQIDSQPQIKMSKEDKPGMFSHPFSFEGRIRRLEYGLSFIIMYVYAFAIGFIVGMMNGNDAIMYILLIPSYWFMWAQGAKRCHDRGNSGWYQIIPFYGLWMLFAEGDNGTNEYGVSPK